MRRNRTKFFAVLCMAALSVAMLGTGVFAGNLRYDFGCYFGTTGGSHDFVEKKVETSTKVYVQVTSYGNSGGSGASNFSAYGDGCYAELPAVRGKGAFDAQYQGKVPVVGAQIRLHVAAGTGVQSIGGYWAP